MRPSDWRCACLVLHVALQPLHASPSVRVHIYRCAVSHTRFSDEHTRTVVLPRCSIARNRARLQQLGLTDAADKLAATTAKPR